MAQNGFFIMSDGRRSCDVVAKKPVSREGATRKTVKTKDRGTQTLKPKTTTSKRAQSSDQPQAMSEKPKKTTAAASTAIQTTSLAFSDAEVPKKRKKLISAEKILVDSP